jgi:tetratricopeptide (TPR) repeat protein
VLRSMTMVRLAQVVAGILVAMVGIGSFGWAVGRPGPQAAGKPVNRPADRVPESWVGKKVVIKYSAPVMGRDPIAGDGAFRVYTVDRVDEDWIRLTEDDISGWIKAEDVALLDQAIDFYTEVIRGNPKHLGARVQRAEVREYLGDRAKAIAELTEAIAIGPPNAVVYAVRGEMFQNDKEYDKAIADLTEAIRIDPNPVTYTRRGQFWLIKGEFDKAIADFSDAIEQGSEDDGAAYRFRGTARLDKASRDRAAVPEEAIADLNEAIRLDPNDAEAYAQRSRAWVWKEDDDRAIADANRAIELKLRARHV